MKTKSSLPFNTKNSINYKVFVILLNFWASLDWILCFIFAKIDMSWSLVNLLLIRAVCQHVKFLCWYHFCVRIRSTSVQNILKSTGGKQQFQFFFQRRRYFRQFPHLIINYLLNCYSLNTLCYFKLIISWVWLLPLPRKF